MRSNARFEFLATCPAYQSDLLESELTGWLPKEILTVVPQGVLIEGSLEQGLSVVLKSRVASRLHLKIGEFSFRNLDQLYESSLRFAWTRFLKPTQAFKFDLSFDPEIARIHKNPLILSLKTKDGLADHFRNKFGSRPDVAKNDADVVFGLFPSVDESGQQHITVSLDLWGESLSHRGYRPPNVSAPIRENLAAAILLRAKWDAQNEWLLDPMCGSGTFLAEAALMKLNVSPRYLFLKDKKSLRYFGAFQVPFFKDNQGALDQIDHQFQQEIERNRLALAEATNLNLFGSDIDLAQLDHAHQTLEKLGFTGKIQLNQGDALNARTPLEGKGLVVLNPPYGERLEGEDLERINNLYHDFGENLKANFKNCRCAFFTSNAEARKQISLKTSSRHDFKNGQLDCKLFCYDLY